MSSGLAPRADIVTACPARPLRATSGREQSQQGSRLFDDLVGTLLKMKWHIEAERLGGFKIDH
jgi:hypothetical protein